MKSKTGMRGISLIIALTLLVSLTTPVLAAEASAEVTATEELTTTEENYGLPFPLITIGVNSKTKVYDGTPLTLTDEDWWFENLPQQVDSYVVITNEGVCQITEPGVLEITASIWPYEGYSLLDANGINLTQNGLHIQRFVPGTLTVTEREVTMTVENKTMVAGDEVPELAGAFGEDDFLADDGYAYELYVDGDTSTPGTYPIRVAAGADYTGRGDEYYEISIKIGTMTVTDPLLVSDTPDPIVPAPDTPDPIVPAADTPDLVIPTPDVIDNGNIPATMAEPETEVIEESPTPLASFPSEVTKASATWALLNLIFAILALVFTVVLLVGLFRTNKANDETNHKSNKGWRMFSIVLGVLAPVVFLLTENTWNQMIFVDNWTFLMAAIFVVQLIGMLLLRRAQNQEGVSEKA